MKNLYSVKNLEYSYEWNGQTIPVLKNLDLDIPTNCFSCLVGPSGTGKTTLLNLLGLLDQASAGSLTLDGINARELSESQKEKFRLEKIGFVFQSFFLIPTLTALENTAYFLPSLGYSETKAKHRAEEVLTLMGLAEHKDRRPSQLSGGQRQRVAIARAIAKRPKVILADEPTANLDQHTSDTIISAFKELWKSGETSFIFSTHDQHLVSYAQQVYRLKEGKLDVGGER